MAKQLKNPKIGTEVKAAPAAVKPSIRSTSPSRGNGQATANKSEVTHEMIARRAYEISISGSGGSEVDNWLRAEQELRGA